MCQFAQSEAAPAAAVLCLCRIGACHGSSRRRRRTFGQWGRSALGDALTEVAGTVTARAVTEVAGTEDPVRSFSATTARHQRGFSDQDSRVSRIERSTRGNPSFSAAAESRSSKETKPSEGGCPSEARKAAASCSASAALRGWTRKNLRAVCRRISIGSIRCQLRARASSFPKAKAASRGESLISRSRRAIAEAHSISLPHQVKIAPSAR